MEKLMANPLRAAGGLVVRDGRVLLVHRPKYDDWAFPKGKLEDDESWEDAAVREVEEETGLRCQLGSYIGSTHYHVRDGTKEVRYFLMSAAGEASPRNEIDEVRWVPLEAAQSFLTYDHDRKVLRTVYGA
jgi:8-oxo-dGTP diphosphatase